jgi:hypothetical protein
MRQTFINAKHTYSWNSTFYASGFKFNNFLHNTLKYSILQKNPNGDFVVLSHMGYGNKGDYTGGDGARDGPPAMKARYTGPPCDFCTTKGTIATQPVSGYRKKVHASKRDSANTTFLLPPFVDFGPPVSSSVIVYLDPSNWLDNSGARAQLTNQTNLQHNLVPVLVGSWVIQVLLTQRLM